MPRYETDFYRTNPLRSVADYAAEFDAADLRKQQMRQNAQALQIGQMGIADRQRALAEQTQMRNALAGLGAGATDEQRINALKGLGTQSGFAAADALEKALLERKKTDAETKSKEIGTKTSEFELRVKQADKAIADISALSSIEQARAGMDAKLRSGELDQQKYQALIQSLPQDPAQFGTWRRNMLMNILSAKERLEMTKPAVSMQNAGGSIVPVQTNAYAGPIGQLPGSIPITQSPDNAATNARAAAEGRLNRENAVTVAGMRDTDKPPVAVLNDRGEAEYVTREQAIGKTPATMGVELSPKDKQKREAAYPKATASVKAFETSSDTLAKDLENLKSHPGLNSITGIAAGRLPGITEQGRAAQALYDKIIARGGFNELADMRASGGSLGQVSNAEGQFLRAAFAALDRRQDAPAFRAAIDDAIAKVNAAKQNIRDAYDLTYEYKGSKEKPAARPPLDSFKR